MKFEREYCLVQGIKNNKTYYISTDSKLTEELSEVCFHDSLANAYSSVLRGENEELESVSNITYKKVNAIFNW